MNHQSIRNARSCSVVHTRFRSLGGEISVLAAILISGEKQTMLEGKVELVWSCWGYEMAYFGSPYDLTGKVAAVTGGTGMLCSVLACAMGEHGAKVAILGRNMKKADRIAAEIRAQGSEAIAVKIDVTERSIIEEAAKQIMDSFGRVDILINGAGGARPEATTSNDLRFFDLPEDALRYVFDLNCLGTIMCCQVFGRHMASQGSGTITNISSMASFRPLTRSIAYSAAKAGVNNFTQWLAVHMSLEYSRNQCRHGACGKDYFFKSAAVEQGCWRRRPKSPKEP